MKKSNSESTRLKIDYPTPYVDGAHNDGDQQIQIEIYFPGMTQLKSVKTRPSKDAYSMG